MKANEASERLWLAKDRGAVWITNPDSKKYIEYTRTDAFIEKACDYLMEYEFNDSPTIADRRKRVEDFKKAMKGK